MSEPLSVAINKTDSGTVMEIAGSIDGQTPLPDLGLVAGTLTIDLFELRFINSLGIRDWIIWIRNVRAEKGIVLTRCSPPFVRQLGILHAFVPDGVKVGSICLPYFCAECEREEHKLIQVNLDLGTLPDYIPCVLCNGDMEMDVVKNTYLKFWEKKAG